MSKNKHEGTETGRFKTDKPNVAESPLTVPSAQPGEIVIHRGNVRDVRDMSRNKLLFDVQAFHGKMGIDVPTRPTLPDQELFKFRYGFMREELAEFGTAYRQYELVRALPDDPMKKEHEIKALKDMGDALIDLVYVALGTADLMGLPFDQMWDEVQRANMTKERAQSAEQSAEATGRGHVLDVVKPAGWKGPDHDAIIRPLVTD